MSALTVAAIPLFPVRPLSVAEYEQMVAAGILTENDDVELIDGWLVPRVPHGDDHDIVIELLTPLLTALAAAAAVARCQCAHTLATAVPEPDFVVCTPTRVRGGRHPQPADTFLVIEVSDTSLRFDRTDKLRLYARNGVAVYWIVNILDRNIEVYTEPETPPDAGPRYRTRTDYAARQQVPVVVAGTVVGHVAVDAVLP